MCVCVCVCVCYSCIIVLYNVAECMKCTWLDSHWVFLHIWYLCIGYRVRCGFVFAYFIPLYWLDSLSLSVFVYLMSLYITICISTWLETTHYISFDASKNGLCCWIEPCDLLMTSGSFWKTVFCLFACCVFGYMRYWLCCRKNEYHVDELACCIVVVFKAGRMSIMLMN